MAEGTFDPIRDALATRVAALRTRTTTAPVASLATEIDAIRATALAHGLYPAVAVTHAIASAIARGERGALVMGWMAILREAIVCERQDAGTCETFAAACSVRLAG